MRVPILATGMSGLVGTRIAELLHAEFSFEDLSFDTGVDITDPESVEKHIAKSSAQVVLHMAAKTDVDACEDDKLLGEEGGAWMVNVNGTQNVVSAAKKFGKRVVYISTDFVFDGTKNHYTEEDEPNPINWYAVTKYEGEKIVAEASGCIVRISYPYRAYFPNKKDFVARILGNLKNGKSVVGLTDHIFTPTFIDDIALALPSILSRDLNGIFHVVGNSSHSVYEAVEMIANVFGYKASIRQTTREEYFHNRAFRPFKLALNNAKIRKLGISMRGFEEGLRQMKKQTQRRISTI